MRLLILSTSGKKARLSCFAILVLVLIGAAGYCINSWKQPATTSLAPVYQGSSAEKKVALTFNVVWGEEYVPQILEVLKKNNVTATFFIGGQWAEDFPALTRQIAQEGHEIGNHGYSHPHPDNISRAANLEEIKKTETAIENACGVKTNLFAPPYGERGEAVLLAAEDAGYRTILWSVDTIDWQRPDPSIIVSRVVDRVHNGAIVLMHPTAPTVHALPDIIEALKKDGYEMVRVSMFVESKHPEGDLHNTP
jgi:probable sporulation protein (polysaccharide deacetylase family)